MRRAWEEIVAVWKNSHNKKCVRYDDKVITQEKAEKLYTESGFGGAPIWSRGGDLLNSSHLGGLNLNFINLSI